MLPCAGRGRPLGVELERARVDAVSKSGRFGSIFEHVPEVATAPSARDLRSNHAVTGVHVQVDRLPQGGFEEARPAGARFELRLRIEELAPAPRAAVDAVTLLVHVLARERAFGPLVAKDIELLGRQAS